MSGQKYTRTNFEEDEVSMTGPPGSDFQSSVAYKKGTGFFR